MGQRRLLPSPALSKPQGLSLFQLCGGGNSRRLLRLGAADTASLFWVQSTDLGLCIVLQEKEKKPLKEGVQDMLVKHHLFSWDIDG